MKKVRNIIKFKESLCFAIKMHRNTIIGNGISFDSKELLDTQRTLRKEIDEIRTDLED